ncbi:hypothetical protein ACEWY4_010949 [Coilia grayii]|uniref:B box-type domain-containing protein n=1 Tax=Coilia grayii TaxID=363190 RepID=A0ABD1K3E3_9TELE
MVERNACWEAKDQEMAAGGEEEEEDEDVEPEMDGTCDACEPDEPQPATRVCPVCRFAFCSPHADTHARSTHHQTLPYYPEGPAQKGLAERRHQGTQDREAAPGPPGASCSGGAVGADTGQEEMEVVEQAQGAQQGGAGGGHKGCLNGGVGQEEEVEREKEEDEGEDPGGAAGGEPAQAQGPGAGKKETVSVERLRCREHNQEGSLYCKLDEKIICVVCAVQGEHRQHEIITLREAYHWQKSREGIDLVSRTQEMAEKIQNRWTSPDMDKDELERYVNQQFDELHQLVRLEEKRTLHLVDLKEAFLTAQASEMIAEINVNTEKLQEEVDSITQQLGELEHISPPAAEAEPGPGLGAPGAPGPSAAPQAGPLGAQAAAAPGGADAPGQGAGVEAALVAAVAEVEAAVAAMAAPALAPPPPLPAAAAAMAQGPRPALGADARPSGHDRPSVGSSKSVSVEMWAGEDGVQARAQAGCGHPDDRPEVELSL